MQHCSKTCCLVWDGLVHILLSLHWILSFCSYCIYYYCFLNLHVQTQLDTSRDQAPQGLPEVMKELTDWSKQGRVKDSGDSSRFISRLSH